MGAVAARLPDGRLHLQHGPIDLLIGVFGDAREGERALRQAAVRFEDILESLAGELPLLRRPVAEAYPLLQGPVARRMAAAVWPHRAVYVTPMAAVAGAVADEVLAATVRDRGVTRAYVNNGGDIALFLTAGTSFDAGLVADLERPHLEAIARIRASDPVRGIATSGWRGRSHSLGIADAVTVLAADAAAADVAATLIANAVNVDHPAIGRTPARELDPDSDLGDLPVTTAVGALPEPAVDAAILAGMEAARTMLERGLIEGALLTLADRTELAGRHGLPRRETGSC